MASLTLWQQSEVVRKKAFPVWAVKKFMVLSDLFKKGEVEQIGERDFRIPFLKTYGGRVGAYDPQMGDMGRGTQPTGDKMIGSYFSLRLNFELDMLAVKATQDKKIAISDPFKDSVARGYYEFQLYLDKFNHSDGTALLGTATAHSSSSGVSVYTLDNLFGAQRLRRGQYINVYGSALTTLRSANTLYINGINTQARTITLSGVVPGATSTDTITFEGVSGNSPTGIRGLYYWINTATSGTTASVDRAKEPEIIANSVDAGGAPYVAEMPMALYHRILNRRGEVPSGLVAVTSPTQQAAVWSNVMSIQRVDLGGTQQQSVERLPALKGRKSFMFGDLPHMVDIHQDCSRNDVFVPDEFGTARLDEMKFFQLPGSNQRFFPLYGGSGAPAAGVWFGLTVDQDMYHINPGNTGTISNLPRTGYYA